MAQIQNKTYRVSHILVQHQYEAEDILRALSNGKSFEELAKSRSTCPSAKNGGDLGEIPWGKADADFEDAVQTLALGDISKKPVRTKFGYHLIWRKA